MATISTVQQRSPEWFELKKGRIGGTRFGQVISNKKNQLLYDLLNERLSDYLFPDEYISEDMQFGIDNEDDAIELYTKQTGIEVIRVGAILSDRSPIHMASPDAMTADERIIQEVKCTQDGVIHIQRFFEGVEDKYMPQIINYFAVSDKTERVDWISYCPARTERPLIIIPFTRQTVLDDKGKTIQDVVEYGQKKIDEIQHKLDKMFIDYQF